MAFVVILTIIWRFIVEGFIILIFLIGMLIGFIIQNLIINIFGNKLPEILGFIYYVPCIIWACSFVEAELKLFSIISSIVILSFVIILLEIYIGKLIGKTLSKETGLILGIILIILGVTMFIGIPIIIYSNKNKIDPIISINNNNIIQDSNIDNIYYKYIGKNYKDILKENGFEKYVKLFEKHNLTDINIISKLSDRDIENIGIERIGDRIKIKELFSI